jgi:hypothetical protein
MMIFSRRVTLAIFMAGVLATIAVTNMWPDFVYDYFTLGQTDIESYRAIVHAAPERPEVVLPYHHAQRFWIYWLIGIVANVSGFRQTSCVELPFWFCW